MRPWAVTLLLCTLSATAAQAATVTAFWLPTRTVDAAERARLAEVASSTARRLGSTLAAPDRGGAALEEQLARAKRLMMQGALDDAAAVLDPVLAETALDRMDASAQSEWIAAAIRRASIALARGEMGQARQLLVRLVRYDPQFELGAGENTPPLHAALLDVQKQLGADPPIDPAELGVACHAADVVLVARASQKGAQIVRFDDCKEVARATLAADIEQVAEALARVERPRPARAEPRPSRAMLIAGPSTAAVGLALASAGIYFAVHAVSREHSIDGQCTTASPCQGSDLQKWVSDYDASRISASVLLPLGAAALVTGTVLLIVGMKRERAFRAFAVAPASVAGTWAF
jgi:hypothetical protein